jgi:hypothetical protein
MAFTVMPRHVIFQHEHPFLWERENAWRAATVAGRTDIRQVGGDNATALLTGVTRWVARGRRHFDTAAAGKPVPKKI